VYRKGQQKKFLALLKQPDQAMKRRNVKHERDTTPQQHSLAPSSSASNLDGEALHDGENKENSFY
jgi:hypothetical protein